MLGYYDACAVEAASKAVSSALSNNNGAAGVYFLTAGLFAAGIYICKKFTDLNKRIERIENKMR